MTTTLTRLGRACATRPRRVLLGWVVVLALAWTVASSFGTPGEDDYDVPGTDSLAATTFLRAEFPGMSGDEGRVVLHQDRALDVAVVDRAARQVRDLADVGSVTTRWSDDRETAMLSVQYTEPVTSFDGTEALDALDDATQDARAAGVQVEYGGLVAENAMPAGSSAELVGLGAALVVLLLAFGSVLAAGLPLLVALFGLGVGMAMVTTVGSLIDVSASAPMVATMVGLGVGIDYALLMSSRYLDLLRDGLEPVDAAARATGSAGLSVVHAGAAVLASVSGLALGGLPVFTSFGYATGLVVVAVVAVSVTLVPALCAWSGTRMVPRRRLRRRSPARTPWSARWAATVGRRPVAFAMLGVTILLALAAPMLSMRTWPQDAGTQDESRTTRVAYDLVEDAFGPGANGPLVVAVDLREGGSAQAVRSALVADPAVARVSEPVVSPSGAAAVMSVEPTTDPQDPASAELVRHLRADVIGEHAMVTGTSAVFADVADKLSARLWVVVAFVVSTSFVLLTFMFRSFVVAAKAAVMNLLSVGAGYGVLTAVFQWGWGAELLGLPHATPVSTWVPILLFTVLFGLSMDYEVFLVSRIRQAWLDSGDTSASVVEGIAATGRVITSGALIMVSVFVAFGLDTDVTVKMIGVGMAAAIAVDATIVRMVLLPATMHLLGERNWWAPRRFRTVVEAPGRTARLDRPAGEAAH
jgi:RND superfamily putative drug exporter